VGKVLMARRPFKYGCGPVVIFGLVWFATITIFAVVRQWVVGLLAGVALMVVLAIYASLSDPKKRPDE
jgi:hypothetical protein